MVERGMEKGKDERGPSSIRRTLKLFQWQHCGNFSQMGEACMGFSECLDTIFNKTIKLTKQKNKKRRRRRKKLKLNKNLYGFRSATYRSAKQWNLSQLSLLTWTEEKHLLHSSSPCWRWATGGRSAGRKGDVTCALGELLGGGHDWRRSENWVKPWVTWVASLRTDSCKYFHSVSSLCALIWFISVCGPVTSWILPFHQLHWRSQGGKNEHCSKSHISASHQDEQKSSNHKQA